MIYCHSKESSMVKRKEPSGSPFPQEIHLQPAARAGASLNATGPFVTYFSSGYCPSKDEECSFEVHQNVERPREQCLVVKKVRSDAHWTVLAFSLYG